MKPEVGRAEAAGSRASESRRGRSLGETYDGGAAGHIGDVRGILPLFSPTSHV